MKTAIILLLGILIGLMLFRDIGEKVVPVSSMLDRTVAFVDGDHVYCAGVWIGVSEILTAGHCVMDRDFVTYYDYRDFTSGRFAGGRLGKVIRTGDVDLGLVRVLSMDDQHGVAAVYSGEVLSGMSGHIVGHPGGKVYTYFRGDVSAIRYERGYFYLQVSAPIFFGSSGGGIFDDRGRLMGICSSMGLMSPNVGYFVSHREILEFLQESF